MTLPDTSVLISIAAAVTAAGAIIIAIKKTASFIRRVVHLLDEVLGRPAMNGLEATPSLSQRVASVENELKPNGGGTMKDQLNRLEAWTTAHSLAHADIHQRYEKPTN